MKPVWPSVPLSRWSKRLLKTLSLFIAAVFLVTGLAVPGQSALQTAPLTTAAEAGLNTLLAQEPNTSGNATLYFETPTFTVSVYPRNAQFLSMNVYNKETRQTEQLNAPVTRRDGIISSDWISYDSFGSRAGRRVVYRASGNLRNNQARLEIVEVSNSSILLSQNSTSVRDFFLPGANPSPNPNPNPTPGQGDLLSRTLVGFDTQNHAVRVFNDSGVTKMNIYSKVSGQPLVNGQIATAEATEIAPYRCWVNYFGGQSYGGAAARYFIRVSGDGEARLEVMAANGGVLLSEPRINSAPLVTNIPQADRPACFGSGSTVPDGAGLAPFVAAVFGGDNELQRVRQVLPNGSSQGIGGLTCVINSRFENAPQGRFINVAECTDRNDASAVVNFLRARGLNSRLIYRNFRYR
ncbi:MAG: hypothetical protein WBA99_01140 [Nodosilinea sp.]